MLQQHKCGNENNNVNKMIMMFSNIIWNYVSIHHISYYIVKGALRWQVIRIAKKWKQYCEQDDNNEINKIRNYNYIISYLHPIIL